jgi:hypothetical protein
VGQGVHDQHIRTGNHGIQNIQPDRISRQQKPLDTPADPTAVSHLLEWSFPKAIMHDYI